MNIFSFFPFLCVLVCVCGVHYACFASLWVCAYMCTWQCVEAPGLMLELILNSAST